MNALEKSSWLKALVATSFISMLFGLIHVSDAIVREEIGNASLEALDATLNVFYAVAYLAAIAVSWNQKRAGYVILIALSSLNTWGFFGHMTGITPPNLTEIGETSGVFFVFVVLAGAVASLSTIILSVYGLSRRGR